MVHNCRFVLGPARISEPAIRSLLVGKRLDVGNTALLRVEVGNVERAARVFVRKALLVLKTNHLLARRNADAIQQSLLRQFAVDAFILRFCADLGRHEEIAPAMFGVSGLNENSTVLKARVSPIVKILVGESNLLPGFGAHLALHHDKVETLGLHRVHVRGNDLPVCSGGVLLQV